MRMTKCTKVSNHYYDADKYSSCPHCAKAERTELSKADSYVPQPRKIAEEKNYDKKDTTAEGRSREKSQGVKGFFGKIKSSKKNEHTHSLWSDADDNEEEKSEETPEMIESASANKSESVEGEVIKKKVVPVSKPVLHPSPAPSVSQQLNRVAISGNISDLKTVAYYDFQKDSEPPVGWLALLTTNDRGTAFELKCGRNTIGRNGSGNIVDISLEKDTAVSRGIQATIIYEPRKRKFMIKSNDSGTLVYVNDELLMDHEEIHMYDRILLGNSELLFIPLCSDKFSWDD